VTQWKTELHIFSFRKCNSNNS